MLKLRRTCTTRRSTSPLPAMRRSVSARWKACAPPPASCAVRSDGACTSAVHPSCTSRSTRPCSTRCTSNSCCARPAPACRPLTTRRMTSPMATRMSSRSKWSSRMTGPTRMSRAAMTDALDGVLPVDKPAGPTSHDIVARARRALHIRRIGHTGTLDPFASGLLLLCIGNATRIAEYLIDLPKTYRARMRLGASTDTGDLTGSTVYESDGWRALDRDRVVEALRAQVGRIQQVPPAFSAKKVAGERAYDRVRRGEEVRLEPVEVEIFRIDVLEVDLPD